VTYPGQLLDPIPIAGLFLLLAIMLLVLFEGGYRTGRWWKVRTPDERDDGPTAALVGSLLALMAFLLAVTMGMASDRFDERRSLVLEESNAIETTYLRAGVLPQPVADESRALLREYAPLRVNAGDVRQLPSSVARSLEITHELWTMAEQVAQQQPDSVAIGLYLESLNATIDLDAKRTTAIVYARVPETVIDLLIVGAAVTLGMVGYSAGLAGRRSLFSAVVLVIVLSSVLTLVIDLDRTRNGFISVSQQPLLDLMERIGAP
jgi:hypothetical protein